ncbi:MAG: hypothetical protein F6K32_25010 [Desertifilum sp. SIO1I2]|nr:hypothetical protein [Desertifilum sp. SIO1I2]
MATHAFLKTISTETWIKISSWGLKNIGEWMQMRSPLAHLILLNPLI